MKNSDFTWLTFTLLIIISAFKSCSSDSVTDEKAISGLKVNWRMVEMPDSLKGVIERVNQILYRFIPGSKFELKPDELCTKRYS